MNAKLTDDMMQEQIKEMMIGESGWTVPWAMFADKDGSLWINGDYPLEYEPHGTIQMNIKRLPKGFEVNIVRCKDYGWSKSGGIYAGDFKSLPVVKVFK